MLGKISLLVTRVGTVILLVLWESARLFASIEEAPMLFFPSITLRAPRLL